jgi:hypothetical protein
MNEAIRRKWRNGKGTQMVGYKVAVAVAVSAALLGFASSASAIDIHFCKADAARLCPGVEPGKGRIAHCLKAHKDEISIGCAKELKKLKG